MDFASETISAFRSRYRLIPKGTFVKAFPHPFLVEQPNTGEGRPGIASAFFTLQTEAIDPDAQPEQSQDSVPSARVYCVTKREGTAFPSMIAIGRTPQNDIVIDSRQVSKLHAYFTRDTATGGYRLTDAGSTNGTSINGWPMPPKVAMDIQEGDAFSLAGAVHLTFYSPEGFYNLLITATE